MKQLRESILKKKPTNFELTSDALKNVIYQTPVNVPVWEKNWLDKWEFDLKGSTVLVCKLLNMVQPTIYIDNNTITQLKELHIKEIKFDTPTYFDVQLSCADCNNLKFTNTSEETIMFGIKSNCRNFVIEAESVAFPIPGYNVQNVNISCNELQIGLNYHPGNSKITTNAPSVTCVGEVYDILKQDKISLFKYKTGEPIATKFKKEKIDLLKLLGLDTFEFTNKDARIRMDTAGSRYNSNMCTIDKQKINKKSTDRAVYELANGWWLHDGQ